MRCSTAIRAVIVLIAFACTVTAFAQTKVDAAQDAPVVVSQSSQALDDIERITSPAPAPSIANAIEHVDVTVERETLSVRLQRTAPDGVLIEASPIFAHLKSEASIEGTVLSYSRFQDGALISLDFADGKVRANDVVLGALPDFEAQTEASTWLSVNAISVLTGTVVSPKDSGGWEFVLDDRLRPKFDLELFVNGKQVSVFEAEPRSIGPVLLVPLEPVAEELGHTLERLDGNVISITRIQDGATFTLDLSTGLVSVRGIPRGVTPNIAYADPDTLLLPFTAVETLTGTNITLEPGTDRIIVELDDRLAGSALPGDRVVDEVAATGFTPEAFEFNISERGPVITQFDSRYRSLNTQLQYESAGSISQAEELIPSRVTLEVQSVDGWVGSLGDSNARFRELGGVDQSRVRGASFRRVNRGNGRLLAVTAGTVANGAEQVSPTAARPTFGGFAAGARIISNDRNRELGISGSIGDTGLTDRVAVSGQYQKNWARNDKGLTNVFVSGDLGVFDGPDGVKADGRTRATARYEFNPQWGTQLNLTYDGREFTRPQENQPVVDVEEDDGTNVPDFEGVLTDPAASRFVGSVSTDWRSARNWGPLTRVGVGAQANYSRSKGEVISETVSVSGSFNTQVAKAGLDLSADVTHSASNIAGDTSSVTNVNARAFKRFKWGAARLNYNQAFLEGEDVQTLIGSLQVTPLRKRFENGAVLAAGPTLSTVWTPDNAFARLGATLSGNSGQFFGRRFNLQGQFSALQSVDPENPQTTLFSNISANYDITRNLTLSATYFDNFDGQSDFNIGLRGRVRFNEPRKHRRPVEGRGILRGKVFFDRNRDGIRQEDEPGIPGVGVKVTGTRLSLNVNGEGNFTIQNMRPGLYGLALDRRSLPLGLLVPDDSAARVTIAEDRFTDIEIPIIASGQIRGTVFIDADGNGQVDPGEHRIEGHFLTLTKNGGTSQEGEEHVTLSASFGQYSFENLEPGRYELSINHGGIVFSRSITLSDNKLFAEQLMALPVDIETTDGTPPSVIDYNTEVIGEA
ncbi:MAG: SdrD B-like domain-containing protein [Pseudomonadota bacterium]